MSNFPLLQLRFSVPTEAAWDLKSYDEYRDDNNDYGDVSVYVYVEYRFTPIRVAADGIMTALQNIICYEGY